MSFTHTQLRVGENTSFVRDTDGYELFVEHHARNMFGFRGPHSDSLRPLFLNPRISIGRRMLLELFIELKKYAQATGSVPGGKTTGAIVENYHYPEFIALLKKTTTLPK